jgi:HK97 family phage portal protein
MAPTKPRGSPRGKSAKGSSPVSEIIKNASREEKQSWMGGGNFNNIAGMANETNSFIPTMYQAWGAYGYQPAITWYQLANMYVSWEYTAIEKIARTLASLPAKLFRFEDNSGKTLKPYYVKNITAGMDHLKLSSKQIQLKLQHDHGIRRVEIEDHPFLDLINNPNEDMVRFNFWRLLCIHLELNGAVGIYKAKKDMFGNPTELHILPATWTGQLKPVPATDGVHLIQSYRFLDQDVHTEFSKEEIIWIHYTSLRNPFEGMSALKAQLYAFNMDQYLMQQVSAFYKNGAMFSNVFTTDQTLRQDQYNEIAAQLQNYQGAKNAGQKFILHSGLKMDKPLTTTAREAMVVEIENLARDKMLSSHDVSAGKIGLEHQQNRSNLEVADIGFFNESIKPRAMLIVEYFNRFLVQQYDENVDFQFDYPHFNDRTLDVTERASNINLGLTSRNEERTKMGLEPVEGGDVILVSPMQVPLSSVVNPPEPKPVAEFPPTGENEDKVSMKSNKAFWNTDNKAIAWKSFDSKAKAHEKLYKIATTKFFRSMNAKCQDLIEKNGVKIKSHIGAMGLNGRQKWLKENKAKIDELLPIKSDLKKQLVNLLFPAIVETMKFAGKERGEELGKLVKSKVKADDEYTFEFNVSDKRVSKWIGYRLEKSSDSIVQKSLDDIRSDLKEGYENGESISAIGGRIKQYFDEAEQYRGDMIARTEVTAAMNKADLESVVQMGLEDKVKKIWVPEQDDKTRDTHQLAGRDYAEGISIDELFEVGEDKMLSPGDGDLAEENINCRCTMVYDIAEEE